MEILKDMPGTARVWIYISPRVLTPSEKEFIRNAGREFVGGWAAHGEKLSARVDVVSDVLVVIAADEAEVNASGCSIDKSVHFIRSLGKELGVDLLDRKITWYRDSGDVLRSEPLHHFWALRKSGVINDETRVLNTMASTVNELRSRGELPFSQSWHSSMWN